MCSSSNSSVLSFHQLEQRDIFCCVCVFSDCISVYQYYLRCIRQCHQASFKASSVLGLNVRLVLQIHEYMTVLRDSILHVLIVFQNVLDASRYMSTVYLKCRELILIYAFLK